MTARRPRSPIPRSEMSVRSRTPEAVRVFEVGPRDGLQNHATLFEPAQKLDLIGRLVAAGLTDVEVGSFVHPRWVPQMAGTDAVARGLPDAPGVRFWALVPNRTGFERAMEAGLRHVGLVVSASRTHNVKNLNCEREQSLAPHLPLSVVLLGMGADMHTASIFPGADRLDEALNGSAILVPMRAPGAPEPRITLSAKVLRDAMRCHIVIIGAEKRAALEKARELPPEQAPVAAILRDATVHWAES